MSAIPNGLTTTEAELSCDAADGHRWSLLVRRPADMPRAVLTWLPALGVAARHYLPFAEALTAHGIATVIHEWRGSGSSSLRPDRSTDWSYAQLLAADLPVTEAAVAQAFPDTGRILGGHSLGGQLACCRLGMAPDAAGQLWLVASGAPYWRAFPSPTRWWLPMVYRFLPWLANLRGALPGRRIGFGGEEARGLIDDWSRSALSGQYRARHLDTDLETGMASLSPTVRAVTLAHDWLAPRSSLDFLLSKFDRPRVHHALLDNSTLGTQADHFAWMKQPETVARTLSGLDGPVGRD
ncbi:alpha/beta hydrolase family protein [Marilutibacter alkalisoli]|uniref:Alpha/beta fold hydrolase n=1 Tax=Marilutibacter alkalisoli TaxID=2591633 RepID=A0A514BQU2_9GAMM|nr:alpha/beta fold hydrolase [Lysobacter alkalisoli]QDH69763.1 alpha/beta fold hydrolase [Lysobacter alkalisoli]